MTTEKSTEFSSLPRPLLCLTLANVINDIDVVEHYLSEYPDDAEYCIPIALRTALESSVLTWLGVTPLKISSPSVLYKYLLILWEPKTLLSKLNNAASAGTTYLLPYLMNQVTPIDGYVLQAAAHSGSSDSVRYLLKTLPPSYVKSFVSPALADATFSGCNPEMIQLLVNHGADVHHNVDAPIINAAQKNCLSNVKLLLELKADIHADEEDALNRAVKRGHVDMVQLLLENNADPSINNSLVLRDAVDMQVPDPGVVSMLIEARADVNARRGYPLYHSVERHNLDIVKLLLNANADPTNVPQFLGNRMIVLLGEYGR